MVRKNFGIFEEIDVAALRTANRGLRLIKNELLPREWSGGDVKPAILKSALHQTNCNAGGKTKKAEADGPAGRSAMGSEGNWIEDYATKGRANRSTESPVTRLF